jgi:hypothetical protein
MHCWAGLDVELRHELWLEALHAIRGLRSALTSASGMLITSRDEDYHGIDTI